MPDDLNEWLDGIVKLDTNGIPVFIRIPTVAEIASIKPTDLEGMNVLYKLQSYLGLKSPEAMRQANVKYLERFNILPGNPLYAQRLADLTTEVNSNRVLTATSRRITQQAEVTTALQGENKKCVYVNEGEAPCSSCEFQNGETEPYTWFVSNNMRPGDQCLGGDNCLCRLIPIE